MNRLILSSAPGGKKKRRTGKKNSTQMKAVSEKNVAERRVFKKIFFRYHWRTKLLYEESNNFSAKAVFYSNDTAVAIDDEVTIFFRDA